MHAAATPVLARPDAPRETSVPCELPRTTKSVPDGTNHCSVTLRTRTDADLTESAHMSRHDPERNRSPHTRNPSPHSHWPGYVSELWRDPNDPPRGLTHVPRPAWGHAPRMQTGGVRAQPSRAQEGIEIAARAHDPHDRSGDPPQNRDTDATLPPLTDASSRPPLRVTSGAGHAPANNAAKFCVSPPPRRRIKNSVSPSRSVGRPRRRAHACEATRGMRAK